VAGFVEFAGAGFRLPDGRSLLSDLSLSVAEGETLALIGRSGSGKTTALKLVNALLLPTDGRVQVDGTNPTTLRARAWPTAGTEPTISTRVKMGQSSDVYALVQADGKYYVTKKEIKITLGGCGG